MVMQWNIISLKLFGLLNYMRLLFINVENKGDMSKVENAETIWRESGVRIGDVIANAYVTLPRLNLPLIPVSM